MILEHQKPMIKKIVTIILLGLFSINGYSQIKTEKQLSNTQFLDTLIKPDYFLVKITVSEYVLTTKKGRKYKSELMDLDTVSYILKSNLEKIGFTQNLKKSSIAETLVSTGYGNTQKRYFNGQVLFEVSYEFMVSNKDSVNYLFKELPKERLTALKITPHILPSTIKQVKEDLTNKGIVLISNEVKNIADTLGKKIVKQSNLNINFAPKFQNMIQGSIYYGREKEFSIDISDLEYTLNIYYAYIIEDK